MTTEEVKVKAISEKEKKQVKAQDLTIDQATMAMIDRSREMEVETIFDRAQTMKACNIGIQGTCCKNCSQGPCRLPLPKGGVEGKDDRKGLCGATPETIAARNFARMVAGGAAAHSDHGRGVAETFLAAAKKETHDYKIQDTKKLLEIAPDFGVEIKVKGDDGTMLDRDIDEIAVEVGEKAL
ncbi:carbon monoxide dehydrogenase, partial [Candidatus Woesearchaeota archaeon]|nr:carbon monoxide dehydrogenase [Candidatus Woesearchaeota archaeon]